MTVQFCAFALICVLCFLLDQTHLSNRIYIYVHSTARDALKAMRDKADYEHNMSKKNNLKLMAALRDMMREDKLAELRRDLEGLAATHAAAVERKDALIQRLLDNLAFAYDQHSAAGVWTVL